MKMKALPAATLLLCIPGILFRTLHFYRGFESAAGLPMTSTPWLWCYIGLLATALIVYFILALPLHKKKDIPFEKLLGGKSLLIRMLIVAAGLLLACGGGGYLYLSLQEFGITETALASIAEIAYAALTIVAGIACAAMAKIQSAQVVSTGSAFFTLIPLVWSCMHLLVTYRTTCTDPTLPSFAFSLIADIVLILAFYHLARLLYSKPTPVQLGASCALAITISVSDIGGYGLAWLFGMRSINWSMKMLLRSGLSVAAGAFLLAELLLLTRSNVQELEETEGVEEPQ